MNIYLNGESVQLNGVFTLESLLQKNDFATKKGIAVAVNNKVIARTQWAEQALSENDKVLVISATKGG